MAKIVSNKLENKVKYILENLPEARENDYALIAQIWAHEVNTGPVRVESAQGFLQLLSQGCLTKTSSISRARRKVQEKHAHLRGKSYSFRQVKYTQIKKGLTLLDNNTI